MQKIFLTGANGHIGANTARELLKRGYEVVGFVRESSDLRGLEGLDIELRKGDIRAADKVKAASAGCDAIIHTAAVYKLWSPDDDDILSPSMEGTDNILEAAYDHGIRRVVYTSSAVAIGGTDHPDEIRDENDWNDYASSPYYSAKTDSERLALGLAQQLDLELVTLNPTIVLGPYDYRVTPSTGVILGALNGSAPFWDGRIGLVHVEDVARLHVDCLAAGVPGERYIVNDVTLHLKDLQKSLREMFGVRTMLLAMPDFISRSTGAMLGWLGRLTGSEPMFDERIFEDVMALHGNYSNRKSMDTFGIEYMDLETTLADTVAWLIHAGLVKDKVAHRLRDKWPPKPEWLPAG